MDKLLLQIFATLLVFIGVVFGIANSAIKDKKFICNRYILNTYLYIILTINIIALQVLIMRYFNIDFNVNYFIIIGIFLLIVACIIALNKIDPRKIILKHFVWLIFILLFGLLFYPMYLVYSNYKGVILSAILTTLLLFIGLSLVAYLKPELISLSWGPILFVFLGMGILMELLMFVVFKNYNSSKWVRIMSYFFIGLFMIYILYDTKRLQINAKQCIVADYISESLSLFLDIWNVFVRLLSLSGTK